MKTALFWVITQRPREAQFWANSRWKQPEFTHFLYILCSAVLLFISGYLL
jgi:hypothetical protein